MIYRPFTISVIHSPNGARRETRTLKRQFSTASETATFTNFAIRAYIKAESSELKAGIILQLFNELSSYQGRKYKYF